MTYFQGQLSDYVEGLHHALQFNHCYDGILQVHLAC